MTLELWIAAAIGVVIGWVSFHAWRRRQRHRQVSLVPPHDEARSQELLKLAATNYGATIRRRNGQ